MLGGSLASGPAGPRRPASSSMPWNRRFMIAGRPIGEASSIIAIGARSTCPSSTPSASPKPGSSCRSAASATASTTLRPRRSMASTRPRSSTGGDPRDPSKRWNTRPSNGSIGSTIVGCWSQSATFRLPNPKVNIVLSRTTSIWQRDSNQLASGKSGAVRVAQCA